MTDKFVITGMTCAACAAHRIRGRVALATTRDSGGKADEKTAQRLAGCKRIVYGLLNGLALLR